MATATSKVSGVLGFLEKLLTLAPELIEDVEAIIAKAKSSKTEAATTAADDAAQVAGQLSPANAGTANAAAAAVNTGISAVQSVVESADTTDQDAASGIVSGQ
jgi:hypothetical protein